MRDFLSNNRQRRLATGLYGLAMAATLVLCAYLLFDGLGTRPIDSWDEARHGQSALEMLRSGDWVVTTYLGEPDYWNLKPPLSMWGDALGFLALGTNPLGLRIASAGLMFLCYILMAWFLRRRYGRWESLATLWLFCGCKVVYGLHFARTGQADGYSTVCYLLSLMALLESQKDIRWLGACALCFGFGFLARSWHAFLIPLVCLATLLCTGRWRALRPRHCLAVVGLGLLPVLPWAVWRYSRDGWTFFQAMLDYDLLKRSADTIEGHVEGFWYYFDYVLRMPVFDVAVGLGVLALVKRLLDKGRLNGDHAALLCAVVLPLGLFTLAATKIERYAFPALAAALFGGGIAAGGLLRSLPGLWRAGRASAAKRGQCAILALCLAVALGVTARGAVVNVGDISRIWPNDRYLVALETVLAYRRDNEEAETPLRLYMQFADGYDQWRPADILTASIVDCPQVERMNGGLAAFTGDPGAWIILPNDLVPDDGTAGGLLHYQDGFVSVLEHGEASGA